MAADRQLVSNFLKLNGLDEYEPFRKWLKAQREAWRDVTEAQRDEVALRQAQGRALAYKEILDALANAPELSRKAGGNTVL